MASINKLAIRGVRAFSPDDEEQVISFCFPLTIIVGANGCGKTTIIEALKYAITGSMPPGVKSGQAFVHDPKSAGQSIVKASIKLRFTNRAGNSMVVIRSMEVTQKKTTLTFKALDGILRTTNPETGERISMSHKCTELDRQIPTMIGVSKPILEHVVFCHQEDSSWPLSEGAVLKKRFDEIFDSTRYAKALKAISEVKKDYAAKAKELKVDLASLAAFKHTAGQFRQEMEEIAEKIAENEEVIKECEEGIQQENDKIAQYSAEFEKIENLEEDVAKKSSELDQERGIRDSKRSMLEQDLTSDHTRSQLEKMIRTFDDQQTDSSQRLKDLLEKYEELRRQIGSLEKERDRAVERRARLSTEQAAHERNLEERSQKIRQMAATYGIEMEGGSNFSLTDMSLTQTGTQTSTGSGLIIRATQDSNLGGSPALSEEDVSLFISKLEQKQKSMEAHLANLKSRHQEEQDVVMSELGSLQGKQDANEKEISKIQSETRAIQHEVQSISTQQSYSRVRRSEVEDAKRTAADYSKTLEDFSNDPRLKSIPNKIKENQDKIEKIKRKIDEQSETLAELRKHAEEQNTISTLQLEIDRETEKLEESMADNAYVFRKFNLAAGPTDLKGLESLAQETADKKDLSFRNLTTANIELAEKQQRVTENTTIVEHNTVNLARLRARLTSLNTGRIAAVIDEVRIHEAGSSRRPSADVQPKELMRHLDEKLRELEDENVNSPEIVTRTIKKLKKMSVIKGADGQPIGVVCPCCRRNLEPDDALVFNERMKELEDPMRSEIIQIDRKVENDKALYKTWRETVASGMNDWYERARCLQECEQTEAMLLQKREEKSRLETDLEDAKKVVERLQIESSELSNLLTEAVRLRDNANRIHDKQEKDRLTDDNTKLNKDMTLLNGKISVAASNAANAEKAAREKEDVYKQSQEAADRKSSLTEKLTVLAEQEKRLQEQVAPTRQLIMSKQAELTRTRSSQKDEVDRAEKSIQSFRQDYYQLSTTIEAVNRYIRTNKAFELEQINMKLSEIETMTKEKKLMLSGMEPEIEDAKALHNQKERQKKIIQDNLSLFESVGKVEKLEDEWNELREELDAVRRHSQASENYSLATQRKEQLKEKKTRCEGRMGGSKEQLKNLKRKLQSEEYKDVDERHRVKMIEHETTVLAVSDLDKYYTALDRALMKFHSIKIGDINKIIRELWSLTYKGEDIYNIEIVSGEESASKAAKSYNYRVVMSKGNTKMDMRGRCSAGQRVLASIVIRLALAETFCLNCGVMCLDEPTTNLDHANKQGLAVALAQIIASRASQHNFQLVVITHDEDFVSMMKQELATQTGFDMPERYFQVSREEGLDGKFYSRIRAIDWDEI